MDPLMIVEIQQPRQNWRTLPPQEHTKDESTHELRRVGAVAITRPTEDVKETIYQTGPD